MKSMLFSCGGRGKAIFLLATFALSAIRRKFFFSCIYLMRFCMIVLFFPLLCLLLLSLKKKSLTLLGSSHVFAFSSLNSTFFLAKKLENLTSLVSLKVYPIL